MANSWEDLPNYTLEVPPWLREKYVSNIIQQKIGANKQIQTVHRIEAPDFFCVYFIGGPVDATSRFFPYSENVASIKPEHPFMVPVIEQTVHDSQLFSAATYRLTFIPMDQTPFAEKIQIVVGVFQQ